MESKLGALMYVSDGRDHVVAVLTYPAGNAVGFATGFEHAAGECVDAHGDVFVTDEGHARIVEFAHGGTVPVQTLSYPNALPFACSVDPVTGDLAVTNAAAQLQPHSVVAVYAQAKGTPHTYAFSGLNARFCTYDNAGNLYIDGSKPRNRTAFVLGILPKGGSAIQKGTIDVTIPSAGGIRWDGHYVAIANGYPMPAVYRFAFSGIQGKVVGSTTFGNLYELGAFWVDGKTILSAFGAVAVWSYPAGGNPIATYRVFDDPAAAVISR